MKNPTLTRGLKIMAREGLTPEDILRRDFLTDLSRIPDLGKKTYLTLREYFAAQQDAHDEGDVDEDST